MAQYPNGRKFQCYTQRAIGGQQMAFSPYFVNRSDRFCRFYGETWGRGAGGLPSTARPPVAVLPAITYDGSMSTTTSAGASITGTATAIVSSVANIACACSATGALSATLTGAGNMAANILPYTPGSAEAVAYTVWGWTSEGSQTYGKQFRDMRAVLLGKTSGGGSALEVFYAVDGITARVLSTNNGTNRTAVAVPEA